MKKDLFSLRAVNPASAIIISQSTGDVHIFSAKRISMEIENAPRKAVARELWSKLIEEI